MANKNYTKDKLASWFTSKARTAAGYRSAIITSEERSRDTTIIGKMYFFWYDPKHKKTLPIYDRFPMVFPIEPYPDGFLGLNLHYLDQRQRLYYIGMLSQFASNKKLTPSTRLKLSYDLLSSSKTLASMSKPCIKRYLFGQVVSRFIEVFPDEWDKACQLPVQLFVEKK